ncbi:hypothetical protein [Streptomyces sp. RTd22]|uniref:hypothetical protein n=1 Tax=Streptomyces sp. RTd22 TaxID=1841249 RepID=UPI0007C486FF|nr:hypothetical protein [Streptomyces sp. RTd22]
MLAKPSVRILTSPDYRVDAGTGEGGQWLPRAGSSARRCGGPWSSPEDLRETALLGIARTWTEHLARMHTVGWAHADVHGFARDRPDKC